jgi:hypothetical protein
MTLLPTRKDRQSQQPAQLPPTPRRKVSEDAAHFAQSILDLEDRCQRLVGQATSWENQCNIMAVEIKSLREALQQTDARLQYFERRTTQLETKLQTAVKIVMDCLEESPRRPARTDHKQEQQTGIGDTDLPRVIADGPRIDPVTD